MTVWATQFTNCLRSIRPTLITSGRQRDIRIHFLDQLLVEHKRGRDLLAQNDLEQPLARDDPEAGAGVAIPGILEGFPLFLSLADLHLVDREPQADAERVRGERRFEALVFEHQSNSRRFEHALAAEL